MAAAEREDPGSSFQRFRALTPDAILKCLDVIFDLHAKLAEAGWIAVDFYDGSLVYDFTSGRLSVIDIDMYRQGAFQNEMGRMYGSSRFMAPEELELGALIDQSTNVFTMGRTVLVMLSDGTLSRDSFRGSDDLYDVVLKACQPDRRWRFESMAAFYEAWCSARTS